MRLLDHEGPAERCAWIITEPTALGTHHMPHNRGSAGPSSVRKGGTCSDAFSDPIHTHHPTPTQGTKLQQNDVMETPQALGLERCVSTSHLVCVTQMLGDL